MTDIPKTPVGKDYDKTIKFLADVVEPKIHKMLEEVNKLLSKTLKVRVGADIAWLIERVDSEKENKG